MPGWLSIWNILTGGCSFLIVISNPWQFPPRRSIEQWRRWRWGWGRWWWRWGGWCNSCPGRCLRRRSCPPPLLPSGHLGLCRSWSRWSCSCSWECCIWCHYAPRSPNNSFCFFLPLDYQILLNCCLYRPESDIYHFLILVYLESSCRGVISDVEYNISIYYGNDYAWFFCHFWFLYCICIW